MAYEVILAPTAVAQYRALKANLRAVVRDAMDRHLSHQPTRVSKSRIKRLRGLAQPQFRLRVGDIRVFYDVGEKRVEVLAIVTKAQAETWLKEEGTPDEEGGAGAS
ncbi:MAG: type II toxin-antitoxin system RelE/ParE family toxin [Gemmatimonadota bacterium]|jgi:mRNA-degrading endonuclease RelE of RelBE toxin-antitoxin system